MIKVVLTHQEINRKKNKSKIADKFKMTGVQIHCVTAHQTLTIKSELLAAQSQTPSIADSLLQSGEQLHNAVHFKADFKHLHAPRHPFLQPQWMSSLQKMEDAGSVDHKGTQAPSCFLQPKRSVKGIQDVAPNYTSVIRCPFGVFKKSI